MQTLVRIATVLLMTSTVGFGADSPATKPAPDPLRGRWELLTTGGKQIPKGFTIYWQFDGEHVAVTDQTGELASRNTYTLDLASEPQTFVMKVTGELDRVGWFELKDRELRIILTINKGTPPKSWNDGHVMLFRAAEPAAASDPVAPWKSKVRIAPVSATPGRHTIHSYYVTNPESPDGKRVLFFSSTHPAGYVGDIRMMDRATGKETVLAENVSTEDSHRAACQQWLSGGKRVAYHEVIDKKWRVVVVDVDTLAKTVVAEDRQVGFGQPSGDLLPMYGCHWNPGKHRDLELWEAKTGQITKSATIAEVETQYGDWLTKEFGGKPCSIFFPVLSPDLKRVFFKIAAGGGGDNFMAKIASKRQGIICYDFAKSACIWQRGQWGHPAWMPDSRHIFEVGNIVMDTEAEGFKYTKLKDVPSPRGSHPSIRPDGKLMVTDGITEPLGGKPGEWGIVVGNMAGETWALVHSFDQTKGAKSWRRNDPHPVFSADGKRIYYNVSDTDYSRLFVAEVE